MFGRRHSDNPLDVAADIGALAVSMPGTVWPYWLECQTDAGSAAFVPLGDPPLARNVTHLDWTPVGTLESGHVAHVDPRGLVVPLRGGGSLDWWIRGPGGWVHPSRCAPGDVRQTLVDGTPVVTTSVALAGGGRVSQTVFATAGPERAVVEFRNESDAPVALALVLRPFDMRGTARVRSVAVTGSGLEADGAVFATLADAPLAAVCGRLGEGDLVGPLAGVDVAATGESAGCTCEDPGGHATAAAVTVVTHGRGLTVALGAGEHGAEPEPPPGSAAVARGWRSLRSTGPAVEMDGSELPAALEAQFGHLLTSGRERALEPEIARALCRLDRHGEVRDALARRVGAGRRSGAALDAVAFLLVAGELWRHTRDVEFFAGLGHEIARAAAALEREVMLAAKRGAGLGPIGPRLVTVAGAASVAAELDADAGEGGIVDAVTAIRAAAEEEADLRFASEHERLADDLESALEWALARTWDPYVAASDPRLAVALASPDAEVGLPARASGGTDMRAAAALGHVYACARSEKAWDVVSLLAGAAQPTWTWPSVLNPRSGGGCGGEGADATVAARFVSALLSCCVAPTPDGLALLPVPPPSTPFAASRLATPYGYLDLQVRRDGEATVLAWRGLWGRRTPVLTVPGLDADRWSTEEPAGTVSL